MCIHLMACSPLRSNRKIKIENGKRIKYIHLVAYAYLYQQFRAIFFLLFSLFLSHTKRQTKESNLQQVERRLIQKNVKYSFLFLSIRTFIWFSFSFYIFHGKQIKKQRMERNLRPPKIACTIFYSPQFSFKFFFFLSFFIQICVLIFFFYFFFSTLCLFATKKNVEKTTNYKKKNI